MKKKKIRTGWTEYFNFSMRERRGAAFLAFILVVQIVILYFIRHQSIPFIPPDPAIVSALLKTMKVNSSEVVAVNSPIRSKEIKPSLISFDPNSIDEATGTTLGLSTRQVKVILNYLSHGGKFRVKNDFKKMYCISQAEYKDFEPYLILPDSIHYDHKEKAKPLKKILVIDINEADSTTLVELKGIGPAFASRIVRFREKLGGFYSLEQLKEVWGINDTVFTSITPFITLDNKIPYRFIHLNTDSFSILASHPYIKGKIASLICKYRKQHLSFKTVDELKQLPLVTDENFRKLAPYLTPD